MKITKKLLSVFLCLSLCLSLAAPVWAADESNEQGVAFSVVLDREAIEESSADQTITMKLVASQPITMDGLGFTVTWYSPLAFAVVSENLDNFSFPSARVNLTNGIVGGSSEDSENLIDVIELAEITFTVPADTAPGTYSVGVKNIELTSDYGTIWEDSATAVTELTILDVPDITSYCAALSTTTPEVSEGEQVSVAVAVTHVSETTFNAGELVLGFDPAYLSFNQGASTLGTASVLAEEGTLKLEDYGADKNCGSGVYILVFDALENGNTSVQLESVAFANKENAVSSDLTESVAYPASVGISIAKKTFAVTLPQGMTGAASVTDGEDYTFSISDNNYLYSDVAATVDGEAVEVTDNGDGSYTVSAVDGVLNITATRTAKRYDVTFAGNAAADITGAATASYGTDYTFTIPSVTGWAYKLESVTIGGTACTGYSVSGTAYTIPGGQITGNIVVTVSKSQVTTSVQVEGSGAGAAAGFDVSADVGQPYTLTLNPEAGYSYTVTATMNGEAVEVTREGNSYTVASVTGNIVFTVERSVVVDGVTVSEYVTVDGAKIWLVKNTTAPADGKVPTYAGENMFWSDAYDAYCYLVIGQSLSVDEAKAALGIAEGTATEVDYGMDVNMTGRVDASDAQLTYNIYNAHYAAFTEEVTVEKLLRADANQDGKVNTEDAAAIINAILNG